MVLREMCYTMKQWFAVVGRKTWTGIGAPPQLCLLLNRKEKSSDDDTHPLQWEEPPPKKNLLGEKGYLMGVAILAWQLFRILAIGAEATPPPGHVWPTFSHITDNANMKSICQL